MSKVRMIYNPDKTVAVIHPAPKSRKPGETEAAWLKRVFDKATPEGATYDDIDASELPDRADRMAWEGEKGLGVAINATKAKILKDEIERKKLIEKEKEKILEEQAIKSLEAQGKLFEAIEKQ